MLIIFLKTSFRYFNVNRLKLKKVFQKCLSVKKGHLFATLHITLSTISENIFSKFKACSFLK